MNDEETQTNDVAPALLTVHPESRCVVVAVGPQLRIFNLREKCPVHIEDGTGHKDVIRTVRFDREGKLFASAGDDKLVKIWDANTWLCLKTLHASKKVSALSFNHDSRWLLYADKFGIVYAVSASLDKQDLGISTDQAVQLLAHYCSIVTCLDCSLDGRLIITADRDFKIRLSHFPKDPSKGAHEIQDFCLGHTRPCSLFVAICGVITIRSFLKPGTIRFVSCMSCVGCHQLLVTGGGDGTVRLWSLETGTLHDTFHIEKEESLVGVSAGVNCNEDSKKTIVVTCISVSNDGCLIAVGVESMDRLSLLTCDSLLKKLQFLQKIDLSEHFCPTSLQFDKSGSIWIVAGAAQKLEVQGQKSVNWVKVVSLSILSPEGLCNFKPVEVESLDEGPLLLEKIEGDHVDFQKAVALADAANTAVKGHLLKRHYTYEHREFRKCMRNDRKLQQRLE